ncbi:pyridoxamine 5'-phosphate oxidase family protein [Solicola gregarius]|uniref:Pyridoxamine 5'-phosphate oxidase family protein n=1 Tax=Solicola gregarius TaxID=2908642 RepID=A0AA46TET4_9ACTN|nr:pyridoxamine 5'-phosphate oxidase family protein [Solicola gregarius]UYM04021.1 pyridoxamine 5'-phosphate oxidase family protein [Solicola gregarius]
MPEHTIEVTTYEELRELHGEPLPRVRDKVQPRLGTVHEDWIANSPFCVIATSAPDGTCDASPKGDPAGSVRVLDPTTIAIPDRPGNKRVDGFQNVLANPHVGILFVVPGRGDTLRVNGRARLLREAPYFDDLVVRGHRPHLVLEVSVEQVFFHCSKAFLRSKLWDPSSWDPEAVPSRAQIAKRLERPNDSIDELERYYGAQYAEKLY